ARYDELDDIVTTVSQGFLGLTINCARCHDHKIDPVTARDYYSLVAVFNNIAPYGKGDSTMVDIPMPGRNAALDQELKGVEQRLADLKGRVDAFEVKAIAAMSPAERKKFDRFNKPDRAKALEQKVLETTNADDARLYKGLVRQYTELERDKHKSVPKAMAVKETGPKPADTFLLKRGNPQSPGEKVAPAFPAVLQPPALTPAAPKPDQKSTGLRRQLANWLTDAKNPLPARVMANRIWQHHFGRGIVRSPNDFGVNGDRPTHPELLDYLASEFVTRNWSVKAMHRLIMLSSTYQMSADADKNALAKDPLNNLLWRFDMRRLTAEEIRDSILALNGKLNLKMGGPGIFPTIPAAILAGQSRPGEGWGRNTPEEASRRSVYIHVKRSLVVPIITAFDGADTDFSCPSRFQTTQSTQALMMLNSDMINDEARALAARLKKQAGDDPRKQVEMALRLALSRTPEEQEISRGVDFIARLQAKHKASPETALNQFALLVLNLNEFVYVD
ncbi:MAG: DUF1553 domain-containing protein, partial [Phycisphaerae bacterium]|nr:DUF1553 domain-containing protein [Tepidisphaeraceae bacterium]